MNKLKFSILVLFALALLPSCKKQGASSLPRNEYIKIFSYDIFNREIEVDNVQVPFEGVKNGKLTVDTNIDFDWRYQINPDETNKDWFRITSVDKDSLGRIVFLYDADNILELNTLARRDGKLSFSCPEVYLGKYVTVRQGYTLQWSADFQEAVSLAGRDVYETEYIHVINRDYYDYISFNAYAKSENEFSDKNIVLNVKIIGGPSFAATNRKDFKVNVPLGTAASAGNLKYMIMSNGGEIMGSKVKLEFSVENDEGVTVFVENLKVYKVSQAELLDLTDEDFDDAEEWI